MKFSYLPHRLLASPLILSTAVLSYQASASTLYWDGVATGNWTDIVNWSTDANATTPDPSAAPVAADDVVLNISSANAATSIALAGNQAARSLTVNNTGTTAITGAASGTTPALTIGSGGLTVNTGAGATTLNVTGTASATLSPIFLNGSQTWNNLTGTNFVFANNFGSSAGTNVTIANGTFEQTSTANFTTIQGNLLMQNSAKFQTRGDFAINGGLDGGATNTIENSGAASKWMFVSNPGGTTSTFGGTIQGNPSNAAVLLGFIKRGNGTQILKGSINQGEYLNAENGKLVLDGGTYNLARNATAVNSGTVANAQGVLVMKAGTTLTTTRHEMRVGSSGAGSYGAYTQDGGTLNTARWLGVGANNDRGVVNLNGGTINVGTTSDFLTIGIGGANAVGVVNANGGTLNATAATNGGILVGERGNATLNVRGATVNAATNGLVMGPLGAQTGWNGTTNLESGTINTNRVAKGLGTGVATFNFNGGTLAATTANANFFEGLDNAYVYTDGGTIENNGNNITINQSLKAPSGNGVTASGLTVTGSGFIDTPLVSITGDGVGAKAIATIDSTGALTGITITNPGTGYTTATVDLLKTANGAVTGGVGATYSITGTPVLTANGTGELTFNGTGITRLTGTNTYGLSKVMSGNLQVDGTHSDGADVGPDGKLSGTGTLGGIVTSNGAISPGLNGGADIGTLNGDQFELSSTGSLNITVNDESSFDKINNLGSFIANGSTLNLLFNDTTFTAGTNAADLSSATRYKFILGPTDSSFFGNTSLIPAGDLSILGLSGSQREITASGQRFWLEQGSLSLVPINPVPEPTFITMALASLGMMRRRRKS